MAIQESNTTRSGWPWLGGAITVTAILVMVAASIWAWPQLHGGVSTESGDGRRVIVPGWLFVSVLPGILALIGGIAFFAQPVRRRVARAANVPLWRTDQANKSVTTVMLGAVSATFSGVDSFMLSLATHHGFTLGLSMLAFCLGLLLIVLSNAVGNVASMTDEQRRFFPVDTRGFVDGYRDGFRRSGRKLRWVFIGLGVLTCVLAFFAPWAAILALLLAVFSMFVQLAYAIVAGVAGHNDPAD